MPTSGDVCLVLRRGSGQTAKAGGALQHIIKGSIKSPWLELAPYLQPRRLRGRDDPVRLGMARNRGDLTRVHGIARRCTTSLRISKQKEGRGLFHVAEIALTIQRTTARRTSRTEYSVRTYGYGLLRALHRGNRHTSSVEFNDGV